MKVRHVTGRRCLLAAIIAIVVIVPASTARAGFFRPQVEYHAIPGAYSVAAGDINNDSRKDIVTASLDSTWVSALLQATGGGFLPSVNTRTTEPTYEIALGDFNEDGKLDFAMPGKWTQSLVLYSGDGAGAFAFSRSYPTASPVPSAIAVGDVNSDGHVDLLVTNWDQMGIVAVRLGVGDGTFPTQQEFVTGSGPTDIALGEFNGDGKIDAVVSFNGYSTPGLDSVAIHLGNGDGTLSSRNSFLASHLPFYVAVGHLDQDGNTDLAVVSHDGHLSALFGGGNGTFGPPIRYTVGSKPVWVAIGDIDGDGWNDLATSDPGEAPDATSIAVLMNNRDRTFSGPTYETTAVAPGGIALEDFTGDGRVDAAVASRRADAISLLENCGPCIPTSVQLGLLVATAGAEGVYLKWTVSEPLGTLATVERSTVSSGWEILAGPNLVEGRRVEFRDADVVPGARYGYRLVLLTTTGTLLSPEVWLEVPTVSAPHTMELGLPVPNPASVGLRVRIGLPTSSPADLSVFDVRGRLVRRVPLVAKVGWRWIEWNGRDQAGRAVAAGSYFLRLNSANRAVTRRVVVLR